MKNRILKGITMLMLIAAVAVMAALVSAHAQTHVSMIAEIPFDFVVGGKSLKAGDYAVRTFTNNSAALLIINQDSDEAAVRLTQSIQTRNVPRQAKLVFHRYGQRYFLSEVWTIGNSTGQQLNKSGEERALERQLASIPSKSDVARSSYETVEIVAMVR